MSVQSIGRVRAFALAVIAVTVALIASTAVSAAAVGATAAEPASSGTQYAIGVPVCKVPAPGDAQCFAIRKVIVSAGTPGARPNTVDTSGVSVGPHGGYTPADLASAYGVNPSSGGANQTVAVVDAFNDPNIRSDLNVFDTQYGLPAESGDSLTVVNQNGAASPLPANDTTGWSSEETLDVDSVRSLCNKCKILLVEAADQTQPDLATGVASAVALGATEISNSYGYFENTHPTAGEQSTELANYNYPGVVITASTGDSGWDSFDYMGQYGEVNSPDVPSSLPDVVAVGGTSLFLNPDGSRRSETVWNDNGTNDYYQRYAGGLAFGATGGGCSTQYAAPIWQAHVPGWATTGCGTNRLAGDVSADADYLTGIDTYDTFNDGLGDGGGWATIGGTSLASPLVAAMWALAGGSHGISQPAASLYGNLRNGTSFYDVTVGGNGYCGGNSVCEASGSTINNSSAGLLDCASNAAGTPLAGDGQCDARPGYDGPTGVGTPKGLSGFIPPTPTAAITVPKTLELHKSAAFSASKSTDPYPGGSFASFSWNWGDGSAHSTGASAQHTFAKAGTYTVTLTATDKLGEAGTKTAKVTVGEKPTVAIKAPGSVKHGKSAAFKGSGTDKNTGGTITTYSWNWGDGSAKGKTASASHKFAKAGTFHVTLTVTDNAGLTASKTVTIHAK